MRIRGPALALGALALAAIFAVPAFAGSRGSPMEHGSIIIPTSMVPPGSPVVAISVAQDIGVYAMQPAVFDSSDHSFGIVLVDATDTKLTGAQRGHPVAAIAKESILHRMQAARIATDTTTYFYAEPASQLATMHGGPMASFGIKFETAKVASSATATAYGGIKDEIPQTDYQLGSTYGQTGFTLDATTAHSTA